MFDSYDEETKGQDGDGFFFQDLEENMEMEEQENADREVEEMNIKTNSQEDQELDEDCEQEQQPDAFPWEMRQEAEQKESKKQEEDKSEVAPEILQAMDAVYDKAVEEQNNDCSDLLMAMYSKQISFIHDFKELKRKTNSPADIPLIAKAMDESHQGMESLKKRLIAQTTYSIHTGIAPRPTLLVGQPGCGKTSLAISFAKALGHGYSVISMEGETGAFPIIGSDPDWKGAREGKIMDALADTKCLNPVIIIDEIDKMSTSDLYGTPAEALLPVLEKEQAKTFKDRYLGFPFDVSAAWLILTANYIEDIPAPVLSRCNVIMVDTYDLGMKKEIFKSQLERKNREIAPSSISVTRDAMLYLITSFCTDAGARGVVKCVDSVFEQESLNFPLDGRPVSLAVNTKEARHIMPRKKGDFQYRFLNKPGNVQGLAVSVLEGNGFVLPVEAEVVPSDIEEVTITGLVQTMMKESAMVAVALADKLYRKMEGKQLGKVSINYPFPVPKDGDSAGLATTIAVLSAATGKHVRSKTAVTGSISLSGQILPVGGIMAKVRVAIDSGCTDVVIPKANMGDFLSLPESERKKITVHPVEDIEEAVAFLLPEATL